MPQDLRCPWWLLHPLSITSPQWNPERLNHFTLSDVNPAGCEAETFRSKQCATCNAWKCPHRSGSHTPYTSHRSRVTNLLTRTQKTIHYPSIQETLEQINCGMRPISFWKESVHRHAVAISFWLRWLPWPHQLCKALHQAASKRHSTGTLSTIPSRSQNARTCKEQDWLNVRGKHHRTTTNRLGSTNRISAQEGCNSPILRKLPRAERRNWMRPIFHTRYECIY